MTFSAFAGLKAGNLRHRVAFEQQVEVVDSNGDHSSDWEYVTTLWASIDDISAREQLLAQQVQSLVTTRIITRYRDGLDATCRIRWNGFIFAILGVTRDTDSGKEYLTFSCARGLNDG